MDEFRKVGMEACIEKIGRQFVNEHRDTACFMIGMCTHLAM